MVSLLEQVIDHDYLVEKLKPQPNKGSGVYYATFINNYDSIREKHLGFHCNNFDCHNLVTLAGIDWWHSQLLGNTSQASATIGSVYLAVSESLLNPTVNWTTLDAEITTGALGRSLSSPVPVHVIGTNVSVLEKTWTASASFSGVRLLGLFNNATAGSGVLNHVGLLDKVTAVASGAQLRAVATLTLP